jgi:hypothetical protein
MKYFYLTSSEIAKLTGHNQYEPLDKVVKNLLNKFGIKASYIPKSNIEEGLRKLSPSQVSELEQELDKLRGIWTPEKSYPVRDNIEDSTIFTYEKCIKQYIVYPTQRGDLTEEQSKELLESKINNQGVLKSISHYIQKDLRMKRGNVKENTNLNTLQKKSKIKVEQRNSRMYTKELLRTDDYCVVLRGKVDGMSGDTVIEAKNRCKRLFKELRDYERVQLEAYMFLTGYNKSILTEHYNDTSFQIDYAHDETFWSECVSSIETFIDTHIVPHISVE